MLTVTHVAFDYLRSKSILIPRLSDIIRREIDALAPTPEREHAIVWTTERARVSGLLVCSLHDENINVLYDGMASIVAGHVMRCPYNHSNGRLERYIHFH